MRPVAAYSVHVAEFPSSGGDEQKPAFRYDNRKGKKDIASKQVLGGTIKELLEMCGKDVI